MKNKLYVLDTNIFLDDIEVLQDYKVVVLSHVLREIDKLKSNKRDPDLAYKARKAVRYIKANRDKFVFDTKDYDGSTLGRDYDNAYQDNNILKAAVENDYGIITNDVLLGFKAEGLGIEVIDLDTGEDIDLEYSGVYELYLSDSKEDQELLAKIYESPEDNIFNLVKHQYLVLWDKTKPTYHRVTGNPNGYEAIDTFKFNGEKLVKLKYKPTESLFMGKTKPLNVKQQLAFDMLQSKEVGVNLLLGDQGVGKDYLILAHLMQALDRQEFERIVFVRNIQPLKDFGETGFLKGDLESKMKSWLMPIADTIGGEDALQMLLDKGKIEIQHGEAMRGRSFINSAVYCTEFQNLTDEHARILVARVGEGSKLFANGDIKQTDNSIFDTRSGIKAIMKLKGNPLFGVVTMDKNERSDIASLSELF